MKKTDTAAVVFNWIVIAGLWGVIYMVAQQVLDNHHFIQTAGGY